MKHSLAIAYHLKRKGKKMAEGGPVSKSPQDDVPEAPKKNAEAIQKGAMSGGITASQALENLKKGLGMAEGGDVDSMDSDSMDMDDGGDADMIAKIMSQRSSKYSKGGMVANGGEDDLDEMADGRPNEFDDLALRDDLESSYTGANSGDELGDEQEDHDRSDIVAKIMSSRRKRDRMPRPA